MGSYQESVKSALCFSLSLPDNSITADIQIESMYGKPRAEVALRIPHPGSGKEWTIQMNPVLAGQDRRDYMHYPRYGGSSDIRTLSDRDQARFYPYCVFAMEKLWDDMQALLAAEETQAAADMVVVVRKLNGAIRDVELAITRMRQAEEGLRRAEERQKAVAIEYRDAVLRVDEAGLAFGLTKGVDNHFDIV
jgi:hypothetical protein